MKCELLNSISLTTSKLKSELSHLNEICICLYAVYTIENKSLTQAAQSKSCITILRITTIRWLSAKDLNIFWIYREQHQTLKQERLIELYCFLIQIFKSKFLGM